MDDTEQPDTWTPKQLTYLEENYAVTSIVEMDNHEIRITDFVQC